MKSIFIFLGITEIFTMHKIYLNNKVSYSLKVALNFSFSNISFNYDYCSMFAIFLIYFTPLSLSVYLSIYVCIYTYICLYTVLQSALISVYKLSNFLRKFHLLPAIEKAIILGTKEILSEREHYTAMAELIPTEIEAQLQTWYIREILEGKRRGQQRS